jgi:stage V sporulation protein AD
MSLQLLGRQTWGFTNPPLLLGTGAVAGKREGEGPLAEDFDVIHQDPYIGQKSFEAAEQKFMEEACNLAIRHAAIGRDEINLHFSGDLLNQITSSSFTARSLGIPYLGLFGACSTSVESMALASLAVSAGAAKYALASTSSHTNATEKQFRYPNEYGSQKNETTQITVTGSGAAVIGQPNSRTRQPVKITSVTIGKIVDLNVTDPFNMGAAMAPAACDCLKTHLQERGVAPDYYDLILTGDLGRVGSNLLLDLLHNAGIFIPQAKLNDAGKLIFSDEPKNLAGGSGCGCMAITACGHIRREIARGKLKKVLLVATGALLSPLTTQQKESIPGIAHAISWEVD